MKTFTRFATALVLFPLLATSLHAHPGHAPDGLHALLGSPFSGIDHLVAWSVVIAATALVVLSIRRRDRRTAKAVSSFPRKCS